MNLLRVNNDIESNFVDLITLNVSQLEADVLFATMMLPPPFSAERYFPVVTDLNRSPVPS